MPPAEQKKEPRISNSWFGFLVGFALFFDILEFLVGLIPVAGWIANIVIDGLVGAVLYAIFWWLGVNFTRNRVIVFAGLALLKCIPLVEEAPLWILDVVAVCSMVRIEDKLNIRLTKESIASSAAGKQIAGRLNAVVKNQRIAKLLNNQRGIGGFLQKPLDGPKQFRQQIIERQKQLNEEKKARIAAPLPKKEKASQPLPEIGGDYKQSAYNETSGSSGYEGTSGDPGRSME